MKANEKLNTAIENLVQKKKIQLKHTDMKNNQLEITSLLLDLKGQVKPELINDILNVTTKEYRQSL